MRGTPHSGSRQPYITMLKVAIITPTDDRAAFIAEAIESVPAGDGIPAEHIVVHDGSDAFAASIQTRFPHVRVLRGKGEGPGAAVTLGIHSTPADFYIELNSDDRLVKGSLARLAARARERPDVLIWTGGTQFFRADRDGGEIALRRVSSRRETSFDLNNVLDDLPLVNARFFHRRVFEQIGFFSAEFAACNDREFVIRAIMAGIPEASLDHMVSEFRIHEGSQTTSSTRGRVPAYMAAHCRLADHWLAQHDLPSELRAAFANWRARELLRLIFYQMKSGRIALAVKTCATETIERPIWPLRALTALSAIRRRRRSNSEQV